MPNDFFNFKQFKIEQDKCSMKVCTDSCVFGAWIADEMESISPENILDIGTGTGLLSLMMAQKSKGKLYGIEIDRNAAMQAAQNFRESPWSSRIKAEHADIKSWKSPVQFDLIVSNPPFFANHLLPEDLGKMNSKHGSQLNFEDLISVVENLLEPTGYFAVLLPFSRLEEFQEKAKESGLFITKKLLIRQSVEHSYFRGILLFRKEKYEVSESELAIKNEHGIYTEYFTALLKDYYLK